ncbi:protein Wiz-like, partial [Empidonax traillii]|uniref:protein Wiz-like n=1 Tax=Empidonax traillii TaxID=164674 RepID=UPI000FFD2CEC
MEVTSPPPIPKKSSAQLDPPPPRIGTKLSPEPPGSKPEPPDAKAQSLTTCEVCGACFETRKGLSSHARSHLRQLGVAESESSGAPIDLLYELVRHKGKSLTTCEVCGACFETRKGLSSHARSHLRQLGVAESESSGAPIDLLYELVRHKGKADGAALVPPLAKKSASPKDPGAAPRPALLALAKAERPPDGAVNKAIKSPPGFAKALAQPGSPVLKKVPPALSASPSPKSSEEKSSKLALSPLPASPNSQWPQEEDGPLNLTSGSEPARDIRCEFCGEFFENRKGLSSHARSHLRQMGVTEWYVNGSPIDTLREILKRRRPGNPAGNPAGTPAGPKAVAKSLLGTLGPLEPRGPAELHIPALGKKVPPPGSPPGPSPTSSPPPTARKMFPGLSPPSLQKKLKQDQLRALALTPLGSKAPGAFLAPKRPLPDDRLGPHGESKHKAFGPPELPFKAKALHDKASSEACCELCGLYFENRKALASHARAHLRQFGVTEWCVNGSPIETLREWIRHRPHKAGAYRSYIQGGRPFSKKFRNSGHGREHRGGPLGLQPAGVAFLGKGLPGELPHGDPAKMLDGAGERALITSPLSLVKLEEHQRSNISSECGERRGFR